MIFVVFANFEIAVVADRAANDDVDDDSLVLVTGGSDGCGCCFRLDCDARRSSEDADDNESFALHSKLHALRSRLSSVAVAAGLSSSVAVVRGT